MNIVPIPAEPIISDTLTACLVGGVLAGTASGMVLKSGTSDGGQNIIGVCMAKTNPNLRVGVIAAIMNIFILGACFLLYDIEIVVYSLIYAIITSLFVDRVYTQSINTEVMIFTKNKDVADKILTDTRRGVTNWVGTGAYTHEESYILVTVISKYELPHLVALVREIDPHAFIVTNDGAGVYGNFERRLT